METPVARMPVVCSSPSERSPAPEAPVPQTSSELELTASNELDPAESISDDDGNGISDPFLDQLLDSVRNDDTEVDGDLEPTASSDETSVPILEPRDLDFDESDQTPLVVPIDLLIGEADAPYGADDEEKSLQFDVPLVQTDSPLDQYEDGSEEGPLEATLTLEDAAINRPLDGDHDDDDSNHDPIGLYVDDSVLPWAKERWPERPLSQAFTARRHLALVGANLCAAGDSTHIHDAKRCTLIAPIETETKTARLIPLDSECRKILVLSAMGQLFTCVRDTDVQGSGSLQLASTQMVAGLWQLAPGANKVLVRFENGRLEDYDQPGIRLAPPPPIAPDAKLLALSELGEPRVSLWREVGRVRLAVETAETSLTLPISAAMQRAASEARPMLLGFSDLVLFGARDHGLWLCHTETGEFVPVPGCRSLTAVTVGHVGGRPTAFVGLFSELEDRAEIACVDLNTGRTCKIAEFSVHSDCAGPEDDPPELARIDALVWDQANLCLWGSGPFGLTRFAHPSDGTTS